MNVFNVGTQVIISGDIDGIITSIWIRSCGAQYQVAWWDGKTRHEKWLDSIEVQLKPNCTTTMKIGFNNSDEIKT